jgi:hypothetical protein
MRRPFRLIAQFWREQVVDRALSGASVAVIVYLVWDIEGQPLRHSWLRLRA